tara:strand:- start:847 stop:1890 length:1044 start_codon:yes stop_codon:yes gene_type:complete
MATAEQALAQYFQNMFQSQGAGGQSGQRNFGNNQTGGNQVQGGAQQTNPDLGAILQEFGRPRPVRRDGAGFEQGQPHANPFPRLAAMQANQPQQPQAQQAPQQPEAGQDIFGQSGALGQSTLPAIGTGAIDDLIQNHQPPPVVAQLSGDIQDIDLGTGNPVPPQSPVHTMNQTAPQQSVQGQQQSVQQQAPQPQQQPQGPRDQAFIDLDQQMLAQPQGDVFGSTAAAQPYIPGIPGQLPLQGQALQQQPQGVSPEMQAIDDLFGLNTIQQNGAVPFNMNPVGPQQGAELSAGGNEAAAFNNTPFGLGNSFLGGANFVPNNGFNDGPTLRTFNPTLQQRNQMILDGRY